MGNKITLTLLIGVILTVIAGEILVPILSFNINACFFNIHIIKQIPAFYGFICNGAISENMVCSFWNMYLLYALYTMFFLSISAALVYKPFLAGLSADVRAKIFENAGGRFWSCVKVGIFWLCCLGLLSLMPTGGTNSGIISYSSGKARGTA